MKKDFTSWLVVVIILFSAGKLTAQITPSADLVTMLEYLMKDRVAPEVLENENISRENLYNAIVDGCYFGIGDERNAYNPIGLTEAECKECEDAGGRPKISGSYVWGLTEQNGKLYWGTIENILCSAFNSIAGEGMEQYETGCWVCEGSEGPAGAYLDAFGDWVPPHMYVYDPKEGTINEITPAYTGQEFCVGIRSGGSHNGVVFLAGPDFWHGFTVYAYNAEDDSYLGSSHLNGVVDDPDFIITNVRKWLVVDDVLYFGIQYTKDGKSGGAVLRWRGSVEDPFNFEIVGYTEGEAAELEYHDGRIYVGGWPGSGLGSTDSKPAGVYRSPLVPEGGFTAENATEWETVWRVSEYDTHPLINKLVGVGGFKSYKGKLYWGMLYVSWATAAKSVLDGFTEENLMAALGMFRAAPMFRATDFSTPDDVEMLYGEEQIPMFNSETGKWSIENNASNYKAKWGRAGIGNLYANYIWAMEEYNDKLYVGTMDMAVLVDEYMKSVAPEIHPLFTTFLGLDEKKLGYDCLVIDGHENTPTLLTETGFDNSRAYGIRNLLNYDNVLYVGTANPLNLDPDGGWELFALKDKNISGIQPLLKEATIMIAQHGTNLNVSLLNGNSIDRIVLNDISGRTLKTQTGTGSREVTVSTEGLSAGVYVLSVVTGDKQETAKIRIK